MTQVVARGQLDSGQRRGRKEAVTRCGIEEELAAAGAEQAPARAGGALLRIVGERPPCQPRVGDLDRVVGDAEVAEQERVAVALLHQITAGRKREPALVSARLGDFGDGLARAVEDDVDAFVGGGKDEPAARRGELGEDDVARAAEIVQIDGMLRARARVGRLADGARVGIRVGFGESDLAVAARVGVAEKTGGEIVREKGSADLVRFLRLLVGARRGDQDQPARPRRSRLHLLHVERWRRPDALAAHDHARLAGIEQADANVRRRVFERVAQLAQGHARVAQAQVAVLGVARVVDEEHRLLPLGVSEPFRQLAERRANVVGRGAGQEPRVLFADAADAGEDSENASSVPLGILERPGPGAAARVADDQREATLRGGGRQRGQERLDAEGA